jgi:hypothetical protein
LSNYQFDLTIVYALWDEEEIGLLGSSYYAAQAAINQQKIAGVINLEMLGYDGNSDTIFEIHTNDDPKSLRLKDSIISIIDTYNLTLIPQVINPGTPGSDHSSFWNNNYGAIVYSQSFYGGDNNPSYHTKDDRLNLFNLNYFEELSKLAVGITSAVAIPNIGTSVGNIKYNPMTVINIYPNPTTSQFYLTCQKEWTKVEVIDMKGNILLTHYTNVPILPINLSNHSNGLYAVFIYCKDEIITKKVIKN